MDVARFSIVNPIYTWIVILMCLDRGVRYIVEALSISNEEALEALKKYGSVQSVLNAYAE